MEAALSISIVGAGTAGLALAGALRRVGFTRVALYEQAASLACAGAGLELTPNAVHVLRGLGIEERLRSIAFAPRAQANRMWDTGAVDSELPVSEDVFGAPPLCMRHADLHEALASVVPIDSIHFSKKLVGLAQVHGEVTLAFADGTQATADLVIGADGVHSTVRDIIVGPEKPVDRGRVAYRGLSPASRVGRKLGASCVTWCGPDRYIVIYYTRADRSEVGFEASVPEPSHRATRNARCAPGDVQALRAAFEGFASDVRAVLEACPECLKQAILERDPLQRWSDGHIVLTGEACHSVTPFTARGAACTMEDAAVLARCLTDVQGATVEGALKRFEAHRKPRTARIAATPGANASCENREADAAWLYGYDAWKAPLDEPAHA